MKHEWVEVQFVYGGWIECVCGYRPDSQEDMDSHQNATLGATVINEDSVCWIETTSGKMKLYPEEGLWTVAKIDVETGQTTAMVTGLPDFADALQTAMRTIFNPAAVMESEQTLKAKVIGGLAGPMMEEYRQKALQAGEGI